MDDFLFNLLNHDLIFNYNQDLKVILVNHIHILIFKIQDHHQYLANLFYHLKYLKIFYQHFHH